MATSFKAVHYQVNNEAPVRRDFYRIWLILQKGVLQLANGSEKIQQPALIFLPPSVACSFEPAGRQRNGYWCIFTKGLMDDHTQRLFQTTTQIFYPEGQVLKRIRFYFDQLVQAYHSDDVHRFDSTCKLIGLLMYDASLLQVQNAADRLKNRFINLLEKQYPVVASDTPVRLRKPADFAGELGVHVNHLNAVIQQTTGKTTGQMIAERMVSESVALLRHTDWSVGDIAYSLGFEYANHFTAFFKKHTGDTPGAMRK